VKYILKLLIITFLLISQKSLAQKKHITDSLITELSNSAEDTNMVNLLVELSWLLRKAYPDSALTYTKQGVLLSQKIGYTKGEANLNKCIGSTNWNRGMFYDAIQAYNEAIILFSELAHSSDKNLQYEGKNGIASCYNGLGLIAIDQGNYTLAIEHLQTSLQQQIELDNINGIANCYNNIGMVHWKQENYERAIEYYNKSLDVYTELNNKAGMGHAYNNLAIILKKQKNYDKALSFYEKALEISLELNNKKGVAINYNNVGMLYEDYSNYDLALKYYTKALELKNDIGDNYGISSTLMNIAGLKNKMAGNIKDINKRNLLFNEAIEYAEQSVAMAKEIGALQIQSNGNLNISQSHEGLGNFVKSLQHYKKYSMHRDSLFNIEKTKQIEEAEAKYQSVQKQQEIEKQKAELGKQRFYRILLILFSIFVILLIIVLYSRYYLKQKTNKLLQAKNEELQKLSIVASETDNAVTICDADGNIEWINESLYRLFGYTLEEHKKVYGNNVLEASTNPDIKEIIDAVKKTKKPTVYESTIKTINGESRVLHTTLTPFFNDNVELLKLIFVDTDVTKLKKAELEIIQKNEEIIVQNEELKEHRVHLEQLVEKRTADLQIAKEKAEESDRLKSSFLANMSHEIRTPMNAMIGFTSLLRTTDITPDTKEELLNYIEYSANDLLQLIENIIEISKIESKQLELNITEFDFNKVLENVLLYFNELKNTLHKEHIQLIWVNKSKESYTLKTDSSKLQEVVSNLINNAIKFSEKGKIEFGYSINNSVLEFFVKDPGKGLSNEEQKIIFERFTKIQDDKKKLFRGAGLGLAISKSIINSMGGKMWVESEKGQGSTFYFSIPIDNSSVNL